MRALVLRGSQHEAVRVQVLCVRLLRESCAWALTSASREACGAHCLHSQGRVHHSRQKPRKVEASQSNQGCSRRDATALSEGARPRVRAAELPRLQRSGNLQKPTPHSSLPWHVSSEQLSSFGGSRSANRVLFTDLHKGYETGRQDWCVAGGRASSILCLQSECSEQQCSSAISRL
eukprot:4099713-Pleurochrysis_carterae.AAC.2